MPLIPAGAWTPLLWSETQQDVVIESGSDVARLLVESRQVPVISFTGSTATGRFIAQAAAALFKRVGLELGGKTPHLVFADADLDHVLPTVMASSTVFAGQFCMTGSRVLVQREIADGFTEKLAQRLEAMRPGPASDPASRIGPMIDKAAVARVDAAVEEAIASGAKPLVRGGPSTDPALAGGPFYRPTLLSVADSSLPIVQEETFGPVSAVREIGRKAVSLQADLADAEHVEAITADMLGFAGRVDILVNNAGVFPFRDIWELDFAEWKRIQGINLDSQFLMAKAVMGSMRDNSWGRIVNLASNSLGLAVPNMVPYMAAKGGVVGFTRALATDLAPYGITVNAICPTASSTPGGRNFIGDDVLQMVADMQAVKRIGTATDIVGTVCFLSSDDCAFVTGQTIVADGGLMRV